MSWVARSVSYASHQSPQSGGVVGCTTFERWGDYHDIEYGFEMGDIDAPHMGEPWVADSAG